MRIPQTTSVATESWIVHAAPPHTRPASYLVLAPARWYWPDSRHDMRDMADGCDMNDTCSGLDRSNTTDARVNSLCSLCARVSAATCTGAGGGRGKEGSLVAWRPTKLTRLANIPHDTDGSGGFAMALPLAARERTALGRLDPW